MWGTRGWWCGGGEEEGAGGRGEWGVERCGETEATGGRRAWSAEDGAGGVREGRRRLERGVCVVWESARR